METLDFDYFRQYAQDILYGSVFLIVLILEVILINKLVTYFKGRVKHWHLRSWRIQRVELLDTGKQKLIINGIVNFLHITIVFWVIYFTLVLGLSLLPATEEVANSLIAFIFDPLGGVFEQISDYLPNLFTIIVTVVIFRFLIRIVKMGAKEVELGNFKIARFEPHWAKTTGSIFVFLLNTFMLILIFPYLPGYESLAFKGVAAFLGALITIGGSSVIANYMSGLVMTYMNAHQVGDWVSIGDTTGEIIEIAPFAIRIRTAKKVIVSIPNTGVLNSHIKNYSRELGNKALLNTTVSIGYDTPWKRVNELLLEAVKRTDSLDHSLQPFVHQLSLEDFYIVYEVNAYTPNAHQMFHNYSELHKNILEVFDEAGVAILSPHYAVERHWEEGEK